MSYCRWGEDGSSVYVIGAHADLEESSAYLWCVECKHEGAVCKTVSEMITHLQEHRRRGDIVPESAFERLMAEELEEAIADSFENGPVFPDLADPDPRTLQEPERLQQPDAQGDDDHHVDQLHDHGVDGELLDPPEQDADDHQHDQD